MSPTTAKVLITEKIYRIQNAHIYFRKFGKCHPFVCCCNIYKPILHDHFKIHDKFGKKNGFDSRSREFQKLSYEIKTLI